MNKHSESIAKAIQVPHRPQQIQICNHYFTALFKKSHLCESIAKAEKRILNKGQYISWKSRSTVTKVELDL